MHDFRHNTSDDDWDGELRPGLFYERPDICASSRDGCTIHVGMNRWRFSTNGVVRVSVESKQRMNPAAVKGNKSIPRYIRFDLWSIEDVATGKTKPIWDGIQKRLRPLGTQTPGFGHLAMPAPNSKARVDDRQCKGCGKWCPYPAGRSPIPGDHRSFSSLRGSEWAEMFAKPKVSDEALSIISDVFGAVEVRKVYTICGSCIPKGFIYCGHCNIVHRGWQTSGHLAPFRDFLDAVRSGQLIDERFEHDYRGSGKDRDGGAVWVSQRPYLSERAREIEELIGRATVCDRPDRNLSDNLHRYMEDMHRAREYWLAYIEGK